MAWQGILLAWQGMSAAYLGAVMCCSPQDGWQLLE
jgi:hypothetical protein